LKDSSDIFKERTTIFHHKLSAKNFIQGIKNLNLVILYCQTMKVNEMLIQTLSLLTCYWPPFST